MDKEVVIGLFGLFTKRAKPTIVPTTFSQSIRRPKPILKSKPSMVLCFWSTPSFPDHFI
jgi:hypothetical protein